MTGMGNSPTLRGVQSPSSWAGMNVSTYSLTPVGQAELGRHLLQHLIIG